MIVAATDTARCVRLDCCGRQHQVTVDDALRVYGTAAGILGIRERAEAERRLLIGDVLEAGRVRIEIEADHREPMTDGERWARRFAKRVAR